MHAGVLSGGVPYCLSPFLFCYAMTDEKQDKNVTGISRGGESTQISLPRIRVFRIHTDGYVATKGLSTAIGHHPSRLMLEHLDGSGEYLKRNEEHRTEENKVDVRIADQMEIFCSDCELKHCCSTSFLMPDVVASSLFEMLQTHSALGIEDEKDKRTKEFLHSVLFATNDSSASQMGRIIEQLPLEERPIVAVFRCWKEFKYLVCAFNKPAVVQHDSASREICPECHSSRMVGILPRASKRAGDFYLCLNCAQIVTYAKEPSLTPGSLIRTRQVMIHKDVVDVEQRFIKWRPGAKNGDARDTLKFTLIDLDGRAREHECSLLSVPLQHANPDSRGVIGRSGVVMIEPGRGDNIRVAGEGRLRCSEQCSFRDCLFRVNCVMPTVFAYWMSELMATHGCHHVEDALLGRLPDDSPMFKPCFGFEPWQAAEWAHGGGVVASFTCNRTRERFNVWFRRGCGLVRRGEFESIGCPVCKSGEKVHSVLGDYELFVCMGCSNLFRTSCTGEPTASGWTHCVFYSPSVVGFDYIEDHIGDRCSGDAVFGIAIENEVGIQMQYYWTASFRGKLGPTSKRPNVNVRSGEKKARERKRRR